MTQIPSALLEPPAPAPHGKEPPGSPPDTPFAAVLDDHQARTADAEGHSRADDSPPDAPADEAALAALLGGVPLPAEVVVTPLPVALPAQAALAAAEARAATAAPMPTGPAVPAAATALPLRPPLPAAEGARAVPAAASSPSLPIGLGAAGAEGRADGMGAAALATPVAGATRLADVLKAATTSPATAELAATPQPATVAGAAGRAQVDANGRAPAASPNAAGPTSAPAAPVAAPAQPAAAPASAPVLPARAVGLEHAVETVRLAMRAGAERGVTHARISLAPRELGSIEVHLRQTADGLVARVVAEHAGAVQQLQQAGAELRRSLEQQGLNVLQLDIGASGEQGGRAADRRAFAESGAFGDRAGRDSADVSDPLDTAADASSTTTTLQLPNGALVDVLA